MDIQISFPVHPAYFAISHPGQHVWILADVISTGKGCTASVNHVLNYRKKAFTSGK